MRLIIFAFLLICLTVQGQIEAIYCPEINAQLKPMGVFPFGVASGDPNAQGAVLWTALNPFKLQTFRVVSCQVSEQANFKEIARTYQYEVEISRGLAVKVNATNLSQDKAYFYRFIYGEDTSAVGRIKTIGTNPIDLKFALVSCSNYEWGYFNAYESISNITDLDFIVHLGDYIYEYGPGVYGDPSLNRGHLPAKELLTIQDYRSRYAQYRLDKQLQRIHQQVPFISVWDDHEIANDAYADGAQNHQEDEGEWNLRKKAAQQVYFEWMPISDNTQFQVNRSFAFGSLANLYMLDERMSGRTKQPSEENASLESNTMLGTNQHDWLVNQINQSNASWNILGNQVLLSTIHVPAETKGIKQSMDTWQGYLAERKQLLDAFKHASLEKNIRNNLIVLTGDIHSAFALRLAHENIPLGVEWVAHSVTSANHNERYRSCQSKTLERKLKNKQLNPALNFVNLRHHGFVLVELTPDHAKSTWYKVKVHKPGKIISKKIHTESIQKILTQKG